MRAASPVPRPSPAARRRGRAAVARPRSLHAFSDRHGLADDADPADPPALDRLDDEAHAAAAHLLPRLREAAELVDDEAADRVVVGGRVEVVEREGLAHVLEWRAPVDECLALGDGHDELLLDVVLVADLAHDLLHDVLERDEPRGTAVLVDDDGHVVLLLLHLAEQLVDLLRLRDEVRRPEQLAQRWRALAARDAPEDILHVQDADDLVGRPFVDGDPGVADEHDALEHLLRRRRDVDGDDLGARDHELVDLLVTEVEDRADHVALRLLEDALLLPRLDERLDLLLAHQRARAGVRAERPRDEARQDDQPADERPRDPGDELDRPDENEEHRLRVAGAERARHEDAEEDGDEGQRGDRDDRGGYVAEARVDAEKLQVDREARRDPRRRHACEGKDHEELHDLDRGEVVHRALAERADVPAAEPATSQLLEQVRPSDRVDGGLRRGEHREHDDEAELHEQEHERYLVHQPFALRSTFLMERAGMPTASIPSGTSFVTTAPAPVTLFLPILTGARRSESEPMNASSPILVRCLRTPS